MTRISNCALSPVCSRRSFLLATGLAASGLIAFPSTALAITWSAAKKKTVGGITYTYRSGAELGSNPCAYTKINASKTVPAHTIWANAIVIRENGLQIVTSSGMKPNRSSTTSLTVQINSSALKLGCRSRGMVKIKGVNGTLSCEPIRARTMAESLQRNARGQTLGTYDDAAYGNVPDLVAIIADSGVEGYVYFEHFVNENAPDVIPVYETDGATEIGVFTFGDK
ncbi:MAG: hypothetical protein UCH28_08555 [Adlercreutzia sp.]|nr:hypothetical protein [Adlercreutzia sp.]